MITAAQIVEKIGNEKEEKRVASVNEVLSLLEKAAQAMLDCSMMYYRFFDRNEIRKIYANKEQPEVKDWLKATGFALRENKHNNISIDLFIPC